MLCWIPAIGLIDSQHKHLHHVFVQRSRDAAYLLCHRKCMSDAAENGSQTALTLSAVLFSPVTMVLVRECVTVISQHQEKKQTNPDLTVSYAHDNRQNLHIRCSLCQASSSGISLSLLCQIIVWKPTVHGVYKFYLRRPRSAV